MKIEEFPGRSIRVEGKSYLYFGGTSYLGISTNTKFQQRLAYNLSRWGIFYGSSRKANIQLSVYQDFEFFMAKAVGSQSALVTSAGVMAAKLVLGYFESAGFKMFHLPGSHPAIISKNSKPIFVGNELNRGLTDELEETIIISLDAVLGSQVNQTDLSFLDDIANTKSVILVVDESHSIGILGQNGRGVFSKIEHFILREKVLVSSLGKALGIGAGLIAGSENLISRLAETPDFVTSSGPAPAILQTFLDCQEIYQEQRVILNEHLKVIDEKLKRSEKFDFNKSYPVIYAKNPEIYNHCLSKDIIITQFGYPDKSKLINRIVITADHTADDIIALVDVLNEF